VSRAILEGETTGLMRILVDADSERILGATILGMPVTTDQISAWRASHVTYPVIQNLLPIHPTMAEFVPSILRSLEPLD
jgi:pyruvate/2-oxoglutarate dehydrogenase complex dihydrolipoamide dehydrogenase (E3) component